MYKTLPQLLPRLLTAMQQRRSISKMRVESSTTTYNQFFKEVSPWRGLNTLGVSGATMLV